MHTSTVPEKASVSPRGAALKALLMMEEEGAWSDAALHKVLRSASLSKRDSAFASKLLYGTVQNKLFIDWYLRKFSKLRLKKIQPRVRCCLELGLYELIMLDKVPGHAAVNETVKLVKTVCHANGRAAAFANAVMRNASKSVDEGALPRLDCPDKESYYSLRYSHPEWLVRELSKQYGAKLTGKICEAGNEYAPTSVRVNLLKTDTGKAKAELEGLGFGVAPHESFGEILLCSGGDVSSTRLFKSGEITVQDAASVVAAAAADPKPGMFVLDCCAAPGGKSFLIAERMENVGRVVSCDVYEHRLEKIRKGAERLGISIIETELQDAAKEREEWLEKADIVFCDVPCSGFGIIRKKPEIRYRAEGDAIKLPELQKEILKNCAKYVKPGGTLVYSTCTILQRENEDIVKAFIKENTGFEFQRWGHPVFGETDGMVTLLTPVHGTDGFFIAKLRKTGIRS